MARMILLGTEELEQRRQLARETIAELFCREMGGQDLPEPKDWTRRLQVTDRARNLVQLADAHRRGIEDPNTRAKVDALIHRGPPPGFRVNPVLALVPVAVSEYKLVDLSDYVEVTVRIRSDSKEWREVLVSWQSTLQKVAEEAIARALEPPTGKHLVRLIGALQRDATLYYLAELKGQRIAEIAALWQPANPDQASVRKEVRRAAATIAKLLGRPTLRELGLRSAGRPSRLSKPAFV